MFEENDWQECWFLIYNVWVYLDSGIDIGYAEVMN